MRVAFFVLVGAALILASGLRADAGMIVAATGADDGDGVLTCTSQWNSDMQTLFIDGVHHIWDAGHVLGAFTAESEDDPTVSIFNSIDNDTGFAWTDYHVNITLNKIFTISNAGVSSPGDWTTQVGPVVQQGNNWVGQIDFYAGTPVPVGGTLDFGYKLTFIGSAQYCQELIPTPEPATIGLLGLGMVAVLARRKRK